MNDHSIQELDLRLQEGQANDPAITQGLVRLYANELFRFAWFMAGAETVSSTVQRLLARRMVTQALTTALHQLHRFQEQPGTFLWLLSLTFQQAHSHPSSPSPTLSSLAAYLKTKYAFSTDEISYVLKISGRRAAALLNSEPVLPTPLPPTPLTTEEITALIEQIPSGQAPLSHPGFTPQFLREFSFIGLAVLLFMVLVRFAPNSVINLPTPVPTPTPPATPKPDWDATPLALPPSTSVPSAIFYEPENPYLVWQQSRSLQVGTANVNALAFSPVDPILAVGNNNGSVSLWDSTTFTELNTLEAHSGGLHSLAFSPDGALLATGGGDGAVRLWEMPSGFLLEVLNGHPSIDRHPPIINALAFSPDGDTLAVAAGRELWFWQVSGGEKIASYDTFGHILYSVHYSPDGRYLAVGVADGIGWILRARDVFPLLSFEIQNFGSINERMVFSPDGSYLLSISRESTPVIIRFAGDENQLEPLEVKNVVEVGEDALMSTIHDFQLSPDGRFIAVLTADGSLYLLDAATLTYLQAPLSQYDYFNLNRHLAISPDSQMIAVSKTGGEIRIWQVQDISARVAALEEPLYFRRLARDIHRWTFTYPDEDQLAPGSNTPLSPQAASEASGFTVKVPVFEFLGGDHQFNGVSYDPVSGIVFANVWASNDPGLMWGFNLLQRKVQPGELMTVEDSFYIGSDDIGVTAIVEPVQIGDVYGELVLGDWIFLQEENREFMNQEPQPGDEIQVVNRWSSNTGNMTLRWQEGDILYELEAYLDWGVDSDPIATRDALILLATSLFAPDSISFPWGATPYTYTIQTGDTCTSLADRFQTTIETIVNLNGLASDCELIAGQTLLLPQPAEPFITTDLNCDEQEETLLLLRNPDNPSQIDGLALDVSSDANITHRVWEFDAGEMGVPYLLYEPELFSMGDCEQLIAIIGGDPDLDGQTEVYRTRIYRWDGTSAWPVLDEDGWPGSPDFRIDSLPQTVGEPFTVLIIVYSDEVHLTTAQCPNHITEYLWNGQRFDQGETRVVLGECREGVP